MSSLQPPGEMTEGREADIPFLGYPQGERTREKLSNLTEVTKPDPGSAKPSLALSQV